MHAIKTFVTFCLITIIISKQFVWLFNFALCVTQRLLLLCFLMCRIVCVCDTVCVCVRVYGLLILINLTTEIAHFYKNENNRSLLSPLSWYQVTARWNQTEKKRNRIKRTEWTTMNVFCTIITNTIVKLNEMCLCLVYFLHFRLLLLDSRLFFFSCLLHLKSPMPPHHMSH